MKLYTDQNLNKNWLFKINKAIWKGRNKGFCDFEYKIITMSLTDQKKITELFQNRI